MHRAFLLPALLALLSLAAPFGQAHHEPSEVKWVIPSHLGNSIMNYGPIVCIDLSEGADDASRIEVEGACVVAAPDAPVVHLQVTQDPGLRASFQWRGLTDDGFGCGMHGFDFDVVEIVREPDCTHFAVWPSTNAYAGTIAVW